MPRIVRESSGNFILSGEWSHCLEIGHTEFYVAGIFKHFVVKHVSVAFIFLLKSLYKALLIIWKCRLVLSKDYFWFQNFPTLTATVVSSVNTFSHF